MTWKMFVENNDQTFCREYGIRNDEGEREVLGWMTYEGIDHASKTGAGIKAMGDWELRAVTSCDIAAGMRNR